MNSTVVNRVNAPTSTVSGNYIATSNYVSNGAMGINGSISVKDLNVDGKSLTTMLDEIRKRLNILVPDERLLHKYESLQKAYDHYKTMEALLYEEEG